MLIWLVVICSQNVVRGFIQQYLQSANQKPSRHTHSLYIQDNQKPLKVVNTASPYCSFEDCATKLNYVYAWLI